MRYLPKKSIIGRKFYWYARTKTLTSPMKPLRRHGDYDRDRRVAEMRDHWKGDRI